MLIAKINSYVSNLYSVKKKLENNKVAIESKQNHWHTLVRREAPSEKTSAFERLHLDSLALANSTSH